MAKVKPKEQKTGNVCRRRISEQSTNARPDLHENEERLRLALDAGRIGTWDWEIGANQIQWSDGHYTLLGYRPGAVEPTLEALSRRVHPEDRARQERTLRESIEQHQEYQCEFRIIRPDGSVHWLETRGRCVYDDNGAASRMYGVLMDIDARKRTEEALRESEQRFRAVLENSLDVAYRLDLQTRRYDYISPLAERISGFTPDEIEQLRRQDLFAQIHPDDVERVRGELTEAIARGCGAIEYRFQCKDGRYVWVADHLTVQRDEQGRPAYLSGIARDITARRRDEEALRASEYRYRKLFEAALVGVYLTTLDGRILDFNDTMMAMLGYESREECLRKRSSDFYANPAERERLIELLRKDGIVPGKEALLRRKDGSDVDVLGSAVLLVDERTGEPYIQGVAVDITERKRAERTLRESEERYHRLFSDDLAGNFIATPAGAVAECNPAFAEIYGLAGPLEAVQCDVSQFNPVDWTDLVARLKVERKIRNHECMHRRPDGREIRVVANLVGHFTETGELTEIRGYVFDDTQRWRAERALLESERHFKSTFENAAVGIAHVTLDGRYLLANDTFCRITQYSHEELLTKRCLDITHPDDVRESIDNWKRLRDGLIDHYSMEKRYIRKDGSPIWVSHTGSVQRDDQGKPAYFIVIVQDISWRKYAEQMLRQSEQRFRKLFEADLMGVYITRSDGTFLDCNDKMVKMLGYESREEILHRSSLDFYADPEFRKEVVRLLQKDGIFPGREGLLRRKDGTVIHALGFGVLLRDERTGEPYIQGVAVDITERKQAEEALREAKEWNERYAARLNAVLHQMTEGLVIFDPAGNLLDMNQAALTIHGLSDAAQLRRHLDNLPELFEMFDLQGRPLPTNEWPLGRALRGETFQSCEVRVRCRKTGRTWIASYGGTPVRDPEGRLIFAIVTLRDITAQKETERQLRELTGTLESKVAERTAELEHRARQLQKLTLELSQTEDRERKRLAEILHDDLQQRARGREIPRGVAQQPGPARSLAEGDHHADRSNAQRGHRNLPQPLARAQSGRDVPWRPRRNVRMAGRPDPDQARPDGSRPHRRRGQSAIRVSQDLSLPGGPGDAVQRGQTCPDRPSHHTRAATGSIHLPGGLGPRTGI